MYIKHPRADGYDIFRSKKIYNIIKSINQLAHEEKSLESMNVLYHKNKFNNKNLNFITKTVSFYLNKFKKNSRNL